ncbi:MAG: glycine cleavage system aminomethyltransferase GcvT [Methyloglobulus sp.]|nr:glycine cleavage system aminomethyltransferase GcvT [Methyloglobulus sp.]
MLKQTPLYQLHLELGAKMVAFGGYHMPIYYPGGIIHEHLHCRSKAGFFDISHMGQCLISGDEAASELERLTPSDIIGLKPGQQKYTVLTNDEGGIIDDIIITRIESGLTVVVNAACKDKDFHYLASQLSNRCHFVELADQALFALQGPIATAIIRKFSASAADLAFMTAHETELEGIKCIISRCGYTGEDGFEISVANDHAEALVRLLLAEKDVIPIGLGARDTLRLEAGLCLYGHELNETITPVEAGLSWIIKKGHSGFPGADTIIRQLQQGPEKIRVGLIVDSKQPIREGSTVFNDNDEIIGHVTSGSFAPSLGKPVAMALLERHYSGLGIRLYAKVRDHQVAATITRLPFIPHRYHR